MGLTVQAATLALLTAVRPVVLGAVLAGCALAIAQKRTALAPLPALGICTALLLVFSCVDRITPAPFSLHLALLAIGLSYVTTCDLIDREIDLFAMISITVMLVATFLTLPFMPRGAWLMPFVGTAVGYAFYLAGQAYRRLAHHTEEPFGLADVFGFTLLLSAPGVTTAVVVFALTLAITAIVGFILYKTRSAVVPILHCFAAGVVAGFVSAMH